MSEDPEPSIKINVREYIDLRISDLKHSQENAMLVQDAKRLALEKISDLRIKALETQISGYKVSIWAFVAAIVIGIILLKIKSL